VALDTAVRLGRGISFFEESFVAENEALGSEVKITVRPNGPYRVEGSIKLLDANGGQWDLTGEPAISLCRCGASANKPFCDGSHAKIGFQSAPTAPPPVEAPQV
jgi:CDGSH-type Zn-finger protein